MPIIGPRLDRPSAIGDEGRPRATSLGVVTALVFALAVVVSLLAGTLRLVTIVTLPVSLTVAGLALLGRDRLRDEIAGAFLYFFGGSAVVLVGLQLLLVMVGFGPTLLPGVSFATLVGGFGLAFLGLATTWANVGSPSAIRPAADKSAVAFVSAIVMLIGGTVVLGVGLVAYVVVELLVSSANPAVALSGLGFLLAISAGALYFGLGVVPFLKLARRDQRKAVRATVTAVRTRVKQAALVGIGLFVLVLLDLSILGGATTAGPFGVVTRLLTSAVVLWPIALVGVLGLLAAVGTKLLTYGLDRLEDPTDTEFGATFAGVVYAGVILLILGPIGGILALFVFVAPLGLVIGGILGAVLLDHSAVPERAGGPVLTVIGLVLVTVGLGSAAFPILVVLASGVVTVLAWDVSAFGLGVTVELGHIPETRRLELYHALASLTVGVVAVIVLAVLAWGLSGVGERVAAERAMVAAVLGVLCLSVPLRD